MYKTNQVLRTTRSIVVTSEDGSEQTVPSGTRAVVVSSTSNSVKAKVADKALPSLSGLKFEAGVSRFTETHRGRPRKDA